MVNDIHILMAPDSLEEMYDELENEHEYAVTFIYDRGTQQDTINDTGFRLRGNTSLYSAKKSFKISFNTYVPGRTYEGAKKLNLIGNHNDPTMAREKLYFDFYNALGLPVRRVSFADVYINSEYFGLYTVVEDYDDIWLRDRYGDDSGALFKCLYGSTLNYQGTNTAAYSTYEQQNHEQMNLKDELVLLTDILNNTPMEDLPCALEEIFDIDQFLKIYALDISTGHWDNYGANQNNYFLYHDAISGQFKFLSYDCDNVLGIDWLGIDWADRDIYDWNFDGRPLVEKLLAVDIYRDRFSYYLKYIAQTGMDTSYWNPHIYAIRELLAPSAMLDEYRTYDYGYSYNDFLNGFDTDDIDGHCPYGIINFMGYRNAHTLDQLDEAAIAPIAHWPLTDPVFLEHNEEISLRIFIENDDPTLEVQAFISYDNVSFTTLNMYDDGAHGDGEASDGTYGTLITISAFAEQLFYYCVATDADGSTRAPVCDAVHRVIGFTKPPVVLNEVAPDNNSIIADEDGEFPDYIELYNTSIYSQYIGNLFISDSYDRPTKWRLPDMLLPADTYLLLFADNETGQGPNHVSFTLDADNDQVYLRADVLSGYSIVDSIPFAEIGSDSAYGRLPNGTGPFVILPEPSPGAINLGGDSETETTFSIALTNNPGSGVSQLILQLQHTENIDVTLFNMEGRMVYSISDQQLVAGTHIFDIPAYAMMSGNYLIRVRHLNGITTIPFVVH